MKQYIVGNIRKIIFESNSGPFKIGLFKVKETNDSDCEIYVNKIIGFTGNFTEINEDVDYILYGKKTPSLTLLTDSVISHKMAFLSEKSRLNGGMPLRLEDEN